MKNISNKQILFIIFIGLMGCAPQQQKVEHTKALPESMKGYELYSWKDGETWDYKIITGTNRNKNLDEIISTETTITDEGWVNYYVEGNEKILNLIMRLPRNSYLSWNPYSGISGNLGSQIQFDYPDVEISENIRKICQENGIHLLMSE
jgi:hypothetical protein